MIIYKVIKDSGCKFHENYLILEVEYIGDWINQKQCAKDLNMNNSSAASAISACLRNKSRCVLGYVFKYVDEL